MESYQVDKKGKHLAFLKLQKVCSLTENSSSSENSSQNPWPPVSAPVAIVAGDMTITTDRTYKLSEDSVQISGPDHKNS